MKCLQVSIVSGADADGRSHQDLSAMEVAPGTMIAAIREQGSKVSSRSAGTADTN
jgi:hypothetical protein